MKCVSHIRIGSHTIVEKELRSIMVYDCDHFVNCDVMIKTSTNFSAWLDGPAVGLN